MLTLNLIIRHVLFEISIHKLKFVSFILHDVQCIEYNIYYNLCTYMYIVPVPMFLLRNAVIIWPPAIEIRFLLVYIDNRYTARRLHHVFPFFGVGKMGKPNNTIGLPCVFYFYFKRIDGNVRKTLKAFKNKNEIFLIY